MLYRFKAMDIYPPVNSLCEGTPEVESPEYASQVILAV